MCRCDGPRDDRKVPLGPMAGYCCSLVGRVTQDRFGDPPPPEPQFDVNFDCTQLKSTCEHASKCTTRILWRICKSLAALLDVLCEPAGCHSYGQGTRVGGQRSEPVRPAFSSDKSNALCRIYSPPVRCQVQGGGRRTA